MNNNANQLVNSTDFTSLDLRSFRNSSTLTQALDQAYALGSDNALDIAQQIAFNIRNMSIDYASKLDLLQTAIQHPLFKPVSQIRYYCALIALKAQVAVNYVFHLPEHNTANLQADAHHILINARQDLMKSRNKFILC